VNRLIYFLEPHEIVPAWFSLVQANSPHLPALSSSIYMRATGKDSETSVFDALAADFGKQFPILPSETKVRVFQKTCEAARNTMMVAIPLIAKDKEEVFQAMLACLGDSEGKRWLEAVGVKRFQKVLPPRRWQALSALVK
jgi:hypothetical protein